MKNRKNDMLVEAITDAVHEYMYQKLNGSPETEEKKTIRYLKKDKIHKRTSVNRRSSRKLIVTVAEHRTGHDNTNVPQEEKKCAKCGKIGHLAKKWRPNRKVNQLREGETSSGGEDDWTPNTIHSVKQGIHSTLSMNSNGPELFIG